MSEQGTEQRSGRVLAINPGTTSTKFGIFTRAGEELVRNIHHGDEEIERFKGRPMLERLEYRAAKIEAALAEGVFRVLDGEEEAKNRGNEGSSHPSEQRPLARGPSRERGNKKAGTWDVGTSNEERAISLRLFHAAAGG